MHDILFGPRMMQDEHQGALNTHCFIHTRSLRALSSRKLYQEIPNMDKCLQLSLYETVVFTEKQKCLET